MKPSIGRIVHVASNQHGLAGPAIVTQVYKNLVSCQIFFDHHGGYCYMRNLPHESEAGAGDLFWRWPPRVE